MATPRTYKLASEIRSAREARWRARSLSTQVPLPPGTYTDEVWHQDWPPLEPGPGRPVKGDLARRLGRWALNWINRRPRVPCSPRSLLRVKSWMKGTRPIYVAEWRALVDYVRAEKEQRKQRSAVQLRVTIGAWGGLSLGRPAKSLPRGL